MTPFLIRLAYGSLGDGGERPCECLADFHTNGRAPCLGNSAMQSDISGGTYVLASSAG